jgi:hypothetical protein
VKHESLKKKKIKITEKHFLTQQQEEEEEEQVDFLL